MHERTSGWLGLVRLAGERLATSNAALDSVRRAAQQSGGRILGVEDSLGAPGTSLATFLDKHVLSPLPAAVGRLVRDLAHLALRDPVVDEDLCRALGHRRPAIALLARIGLVADLRLVPLVAEVARDRWPLTDGATLFRTAGDR